MPFKFSPGARVRCLVPDEIGRVEHIFKTKNSDTEIYLISAPFGLLDPITGKRKRNRARIFVDSRYVIGCPPSYKPKGY